MRAESVEVRAERWQSHLDQLEEGLPNLEAFAMPDSIFLPKREAFASLQGDAIYGTDTHYAMPFINLHLHGSHVLTSSLFFAIT